MNIIRKGNLSANLTKMSRFVAQPMNPAVAMMNKDVPITGSPFFFILQNHQWKLKTASNEQRFTMLKKGMTMDGAEKALRHYEFDKFIIIKSLTDRGDNIKEGDFQLAMITSEFDPRETTGFELVYPKWDDAAEELESNSVTNSVTSGRSYAQTLSDSDIAAEWTSSIWKDSPLISGKTPTNRLRATSPTETITTVQTAETATVSDDLSKKFVSLMGEMGELDDKDFFVTCMLMAASSDDHVVAAFNQMGAGFWNARNGMFSRKQSVPAPTPPEEICVDEHED